jgi:hypothetical protein
MPSPMPSKPPATSSPCEPVSTLTTAPPFPNGKTS